MEFFLVGILDAYIDARDILVLKTEKPSDFQFQAGQYAIISLPVNGADVMKPFSIACSPLKDYLVFATKNTASDFKKKWAALKKGGAIKISKARGTFLFDASIQESVFLSGGIGITPLKSMLEYVADKKLPNHITLLYSNSVWEDIPFLKELQTIDSKNIRVTFTITRPEEPEQKIKCRTGRINAAMVKDVASLDATYYICGPPAMVQAMEKILAELKVDARKIKKELFTGYT